MKWGFKSLLASIFYGGSSKFRPYERACLDKWRESLSNEATNLLNRQMSFFDFIQRQSKDKLVVFYSMTYRSSKDWPEDVLFPLKANEIRVAQMTISSSLLNHPLKADIVLHKGRLSSIEFNQEPKIKDDRFNIENIEVFADPMVVEVVSIGEAVSAIPWIKTLPPLTKFLAKTALAVDQRQKLIKQIDAVFPSDFIDLMGQVDGFESEECIVYGLKSIRKIVRPDCNYYILAEVKNKGDIAVIEGSSSAKIIYLDYETNSSEVIGDSFLEVFSKKLKE